MPDSPTQPDAPQLEGGTYEILRNRLKTHGTELGARLTKLNAGRKEVFGSIEQTLLATVRVTTDHNCVPRDMVAVGGKFMLGYNVHFGLKTERSIVDVFSAFSFDAQAQGLQPLGLEVLESQQFSKDFQDVYRYYKDARFAKFFVRSPHLYMVFQVGKSARDIKTFKWLVQEESLSYLDNRSDHEVKWPSQHEFEWKRTTRDMHQFGAHPHVSVEDRIFVETVGGDLTIKVEDNTDSGQGIYSEPVENADQTLDDAEIYYAIVGHVILLRIKPYQEQAYRYIVYNEKIQQARRIDSLADACILLPDDHGLIFPNGYYLQTGEAKTFDSQIQGLVFERRIASPNGEDTLYVFYQPESGDYVLLGYNVIAQRVETPILCHGFTLFPNGEMLLFKGNHEPQKHHAIQVWQTPFVGPDFVPAQTTDSYLYKIGNRDIVRGMAECHEILGLIDKEDSYSGLYLDIVKETTDVLDSYFWVSHDDAANLSEPLTEIRNAARAAVDEFDKVTRVRAHTQTETERVSAATRELLNQIGRGRFDAIDSFVQSLAGLRSIRGEIIALRELRYVDTTTVEQLELQVTEATDRLSHRCVEFLLQPKSLASYETRIGEQTLRIDKSTKVAEAKKLEGEIAASAGELEMLIEIVSNLKIDDATQRTTIIDNISAIFSQVNTARAALKRRTQELASVEGAAEFSSQLKLLNQSVVNYLDVCDSPEKCEEYLTKLLVQVEELEGKFAEFDDFIVQLAEKRDEVASAFESRRSQLVEQRNKRANALAQAADRILKGVKSRVDGLTSINDIHGYFAADLMIEKVRDIIRQLEALGDSVKVDDIQSRLKTIREDAVRQLKDRQELFEGGDNVIRFGKHRFSVNTQSLDLTTVLRDDRLNLHLTGTDFYEPVVDDALEATRDVWDMEVVSENRDVYRAEYLAYQMLMAAAGDSSIRPNELLASVRQFMGPRYAEGYTKGVHDQDAAILLKALIEIDDSCGLLRYSSAARALASTFWRSFGKSARKKLMASRLAGFGAAAQLFPGTSAQQQYIAELRQMLDDLPKSLRVRAAADCVLLDESATYLFHELTDPNRDGRGSTCVVSDAAAQLMRSFREYLHNHGAEQRFAAAQDAVKADPEAAYELAQDWMSAYVGAAARGPAQGLQPLGLNSHVDEAAVLLLEADIDPRRVVAVQTRRQLNGLVGAHSVIGEGGTYQLDFNCFLAKLTRFEQQVVPAFRRYHEVKTETVATAREEMKLSEFQPRVLTSFVRNKLIDSVYLPLIGDNLAKQIGTTGEGKRTDRQGLLLLISPPGYGKTTLMEYIANRLGIIFMKINGPAIGHDVTSLDPAAAKNAGAREEVEKLNLAFEMGDNVMIYLDDIQHCHPEFLQKFISLCDAQRKIEGVWKGKTRTYDFRGKKVAVVMAGNPYTESGDKFQIPDMLANRADIYNLGEIIGDSDEAFELSYLENALTSNPVLGKLAARSQKDVYSIIKLSEHARKAQGVQPLGLGDQALNLEMEGIEFESQYAMAELQEFVSTMLKLMRVRDVVLTVNREYIRSAAQHDDYRVEPPFLLQGSYRNMNRIAEKVLPVMNAKELETLIVSSYQNDAQTLTTGTEANLLKFKQLLGILTPREQTRWEDITRTFRQNVKLRGVGDDDKVGQVIATLSTFSDGLDAIRKSVDVGATTLSARAADPVQEAAQAAQFQALTEALAAQISSLGVQLQSGLKPLAEFSSRPLQVTIPPLEVKWPEVPSAANKHVPSMAAGAGPVAGPDDDEAEESNPDPSRITVINRLPKTVYNVLEHQFNLMQGWLKPLAEMSIAQQGEIKQLRPMVEECLKHYRLLLSKLEEAHDRTAE
ncbi:MAG: DNA repair ATPase [Planctomycetaceae bacterium]